MYLKSIKMIQFRSFYSKKIELSNKINIITGLNAVGKTSVLEAINYLGVTKSFKDVQDSDLVMSEKKEMAIIGELENKRGTNLVKITRNEAGKLIYVNDTRYKKISQYMGEVLCVSFSLYDVHRLISDSRNRRRIFEPIICQISNVYVSECNNYKKVLSERNALLKRLMFENKIGLEKVLEILDSQMSKSAKTIIKIRTEVINEINEKINLIHNKICSSNEVVEIKYLPSADYDSIESKLRANLENDKKRGTTNCGPHRDDFEFIINGENVVTKGSQGQQKNILISLKIVFVEIMKKLKNEYPILILDDVFGELDKIRQNNLLESINPEVQTIISSSTLSEIDKKILDKSFVINLEKEKM